MTTAEIESYHFFSNVITFDKGILRNLVSIGTNISKYSNYLKSRQIKRRYKFKNILLVLSAVIPSKKKQGNHSVNEAKNLRYDK